MPNTIRVSHETKELVLSFVEELNLRDIAPTSFVVWVWLRSKTNDWVSRRAVQHALVELCDEGALVRARVERDGQVGATPFRYALCEEFLALNGFGADEVKLLYSKLVVE